MRFNDFYHELLVIWCIFKIPWGIFSLSLDLDGGFSAYGIET